MKENYIYMDCSIRMSTNAMSNLMYAIIMTQSEITSTWGCGIYQFSRKQNSYNQVDFRIHLDPNKIEQFQELAGIKLKTPPKMTL